MSPNGSNGSDGTAAEYTKNLFTASLSSLPTSSTASSVSSAQFHPLALVGGFNTSSLGLTPNETRGWKILYKIRSFLLFPFPVTWQKNPKIVEHLNFDKNKKRNVRWTRRLSKSFKNQEYLKKAAVISSCINVTITISKKYWNRKCKYATVFLLEQWTFSKSKFNKQMSEITEEPSFLSSLSLLLGD